MHRPLSALAGALLAVFCNLPGAPTPQRGSADWYIDRIDYRGVGIQYPPQPYQYTGTVQWVGIVPPIRRDADDLVVTVRLYGEAKYLTGRLVVVSAIGTADYNPITQLTTSQILGGTVTDSYDLPIPGFTIHDILTIPKGMSRLSTIEVRVPVHPDAHAFGGQYVGVGVAP